MATRERTQGVKVHSLGLHEELVADLKPETRVKSSPGRRESRRRLPETKRPWSTPVSRSSTALSANSSRSSLDQSAKIQNWLCQKSIRGVQERADPESKETKKLYMAVLDRENTFVKDVDNFLTEKSFLDLRKKEMLYKKWNERIFAPLQEQMYREMKGNYAALDKRKRALFMEYLRHRNKKGFVSLDTFDPREYDPLKLVLPRPAPIVAVTDMLDDPLISQQRNMNEEDRTIIRCRTGRTLSDSAVEVHRLPPLPLVPLGRHGTECRTWLAMPLHDIESPARLGSRRRMKGVFNDCHFDFEEWSKMSFDPTIVDEEMKCQKKRVYTSQQPTMVST
ncbi:protein FAM228B-like [Asterias amurensis]|uniref:protein FAM228B-like n=1 Tax=Asterias amurensis TaxID=7602 RepID=UPI003AB17BE5